MITSTVPAAVNQLYTYMQTVVTNNPTLNAAAFLGRPIGAYVPNNFLAVGKYETWEPISPETYEWAAVPGNSYLRTEKYSLQGCVRAWAGDSDPLSRLSDGFTLLNSLDDLIIHDLTPSNGTVLTPSGSWGEFKATVEAFGPLGGRGYGIVIGFELEVINAQVSTT